MAKAADGPDKNAIPSKWNNAMPEALPIGIIAFTGSGTTENLTNKARKTGFQYGW